jgi:DNA (cytosine-5)-methyltransferase 1
VKQVASFRFIDLFAGIGGFRLAFENLGGQCALSSEWDKFAQATYLANFGHTPMGDIKEIESDQLPQHQIVTAGFPCQPFSHAGHRKGFSDTRGTLFFDVARLISSSRPEMVLLENVKGLLRHDNGRTLERILDTLSDLGYNTFYEVLNAKDFGLPQNRARIYIVGINVDKLGDFDFSFPVPKPSTTRLGDILEKRVDAKYTISDRLWTSHQRRKRDHLARGNGFGFSIFDPQSTYTSTLSARYFKDGSEILISQKGRNPRKLTPREAARLQGFPDTFKISVSDTQAYKQFGNSVPVPVIEAIGRQMLQVLLSPESARPFPHQSK